MLIKNIILSLIVGLFLVGLISPIDVLPPQKQGECINIPQTCSDCSFVNISVAYENGTVLVENQEMTKIGVRYNYTFCETNGLGEYLIETLGDSGGVNTIASYSFEVTPSGKGGVTEGEGIVLLISLASIFLISFLFFFISFSFRGNKDAVLGSKEANGNPVLRFVFIALSFITGLVAVLYSSVALMETFWGFDKIIESYSAFIYVIFAIFLLIFIFILIGLFLKSIELMKVKRGLVVR